MPVAMPRARIFRGVESLTASPWFPISVSDFQFPVSGRRFPIVRIMVSSFRCPIFGYDSRFLLSSLYSPVFASRFAISESVFRFPVRSPRQPKRDVYFGCPSHPARPAPGPGQELDTGRSGLCNDNAKEMVGREPLSRREGLRNMGNTCYVNACLQVGGWVGGWVGGCGWVRGALIAVSYMAAVV